MVPCLVDRQDSVEGTWASQSVHETFADGRAVTAPNQDYERVDAASPGTGLMGGLAAGSLG